MIFRRIEVLEQRAADDPSRERPTSNNSSGAARQAADGSNEDPSDGGPLADGEGNRDSRDEISEYKRVRLLNHDGIREALSDYFVFRFTRAGEHSRCAACAEAGSRREPSWDRAVRIETLDVSDLEISKVIRRLNPNTIPAAEKWATLSMSQKRQIDLTREWVEEEFGNQRSTARLVQLSDCIKPRDSRTNAATERVSFTAYIKLYRQACSSSQPVSPLMPSTMSRLGNRRNRPRQMTLYASYPR